jgi:excisionase family DNA binding protein
MENLFLTSLTAPEIAGIFRQELTKFFQENPPIQPFSSETNESPRKISEVAERYNVSEVTVHQWKKEGKIPFHRFGNRIFFFFSETDQALKNTKK